MYSMRLLSNLSIQRLFQRLMSKFYNLHQKNSKGFTKTKKWLRCSSRLHTHRDTQTVYTSAQYAHDHCLLCY